MVSLRSFALFSLATVGALAGPLDKRSGLWKHSGQCLTDSEAQQVADNYAQLIRSYSKSLADASLTTDFTDYSESVNSLINTCPQGSAAVTLPLLSPTFSSRDQFETGQGQQAPINFFQLGIWNDCTSVTIRWKTTNTAPIATPRPVVGLIVLLVEKAPAGSTYPWLINEVFSEFDAAAWLQNLEEAGICSVTAASSPPIPASTTPAPAATVSPDSAYSAASPPAPPASSVASAPSYVASGASAAASPSASSSWLASKRSPSPTPSSFMA